jgi:hypothetical protein
VDSQENARRRLKLELNKIDNSIENIRSSVSLITLFLFFIDIGNNFILYF